MKTAYNFGPIVLVFFLVALALTATVSQATSATLIDVDVIHPAVEKGKPAGQANCTDEGAASNTYSLLSWRVDSEIAHFNANSKPSYLSDQTAVMQAAFDAWTGAPRVTVVGDGSATRESANRANEIMFGRTGGSLATTYTWRWSDSLIESDVVFNLKYKWFNASDFDGGCIEGAGSTYDVRNIATHEFGHVYGLGHPSGARFETMYAYGYSGETLKWTPTPGGDLEGIKALY